MLTVFAQFDTATLCAIILIIFLCDSIIPYSSLWSGRGGIELNNGHAYPIKMLLLFRWVKKKLYVCKEPTFLLSFRLLFDAWLMRTAPWANRPNRMLSDEQRRWSKKWTLLSPSARLRQPEYKSVIYGVDCARDGHSPKKGCSWKAVFRDGLETACKSSRMRGRTRSLPTLNAENCINSSNQFKSA